MAPNKKKKKNATNPARGFATTSQPSKSKIVEADKVTPGEESISASSDVESASKTAAKQSSVKPEDTVAISQMTPEQLEAHLESSEVQRIVDAHGSRCRQEVSLQISRLENERRQLRSQDNSHKIASAGWLSTGNIAKILTETIDGENNPTKGDRQARAFNDEALLIHLWTLQKTLMALNFPEISNVLDHILELTFTDRIVRTDYTWGLHEALEWYTFHCAETDLPDYETGTMLLVGEDNEGDDSLEIADQRQATVNSVPPTVERSVNTESDLAQDTGDELSSLPPSDSDNEDPAFLSAKYVQLQTSLFRTEEAMKHHPRDKLMSRKVKIKARIEKIVRDPLTDMDTAEFTWQAERRELEIEIMRAEKSNRISANGRDHNSTDTSLHDESDDNVGAFLQLHDSELQEPAGNDSKTITVIDFGVCSGVQPRKLMEEYCKTLDAVPQVRFTIISTSSHSCRQRARLTTSPEQSLDAIALASLPKGIAYYNGQKYLDIEMADIAASTQPQAESYLSCLVLFLLSASNKSDHRQSTRLPSLWRNVYQDLVERRRLLLDEEDKAILMALRSAMEMAFSKLNAREGLRDDVQNIQKSAAIAYPFRFQKELSIMDESQVRATWNLKASTSAYQHFLLQRKNLPVYDYKHQVLDAIERNSLVIVCADTGAGKSTQIPAFILEQAMSNGRDSRIFVTQPRRISAISLARRVSQELGELHSDLGTSRSLVGYAIRLESKTSKTTRITFATTGVLLRMIESSPDLNEVDFLVLDEVHERTMDLDLLFIVIKRLQLRRDNLRVILMSATVDAQKFSTYFDFAPVLSIPGRTYPVEVKYLEDAIEETLSMSPTGTSNAEFLDDVSSEDSDETRYHPPSLGTSFPDIHSYSSKTRSLLANMNHHRIDFELVANTAVVIATRPTYLKYSKAILIFMPGIAEIRRLHNILLTKEVFARGWMVHLLHSSFSTEDLERAFSLPTNGQRKIVISTNIAETGITIPDVTAVIDTCKEKVMRFNERRQLSKLAEGFISRSSARQRRGRAARVQEGICFHLVTRDRYENAMLEQHVPEMLRLSLQDAVLRVKIWNLGPIEETLSAAIDPPTMKNVRRAVERLREAGALDNKDEFTQLGRLLARLPLEVVLGKMALLGIFFRCLDATTTIIATLTSKSPFLPDRSSAGINPQQAFNRSQSDLISTLHAFRGWQKARSAGMVHQFCRKHYLSDSALSAIEDQKFQLLAYLVEAELLILEPAEKGALSRARTSLQSKKDFVLPTRYNTYEHDEVLCALIASAYYPKILERERTGFRNVYTNQHVKLAPHSVINRSNGLPPKWVSFYNAMQAKSGALNVYEASSVPELAVVTLLGDASFKFYSGVMVVDNGKLRFSVKGWKQLAAIKALRTQLKNIMLKFWQVVPLELAPADEAWLHMLVQLMTGQSLTTL